MRTHEIVATLPAADLLDACAQAAWECGDPGLQFEDTINSWNTCPRSGRINASNPCGEFMHLDDSACNLATLNLLAFLRADGSFDCDGFVHAIDTLVLAQDVLVSCSGYPSPETAKGALRFRQLGLGYSNLGALLLSLAVPYDSDEARGWAAAITALLGGAAYRRSAELATGLGAFEAFDENREPMLAVIERQREALGGVARESAPGAVLDAAARGWDSALEEGFRHGFRNAQTTLIAPTGTVSLTMDCETTGIEPYYSLGSVKHFSEGGSARLPTRALQRALARLGYLPEQAAAIEAHVRRCGHAAGAPGLSPAHRPVFATAVGPDAIAPAAHVAMVAAVQPFVSGGVSKTVNMPTAASADDVRTTLVDAWRSGLKAIAVYREGTKLGQPLEER